MVYKPGAWDLPGGHLALDETLEHCLRREIGEETGLEVEIVRMLGVRKASARPYVQVIYACKPAGSRRELLLQPREHSDARWVTVEEVTGLGELIPCVEVLVKWGMLGHVAVACSEPSGWSRRRVAGGGAHRAPPPATRGPSAWRPRCAGAKRTA